ncbi:MAG: FHA domain-containing protein [Verrucomicrobia bacterium]|nr:MAG: FHA domain-containing protein [Verrucomicrobiota bacterium]
MARAILSIEPHNPCFANNYYIAALLNGSNQKIPPGDLLGDYTNDFIAYNWSVASESTPTHAWEKDPTIKSKLLFMDYRFRKLARCPLFISDDSGAPQLNRQIHKLIITFGRNGYRCNDVQVAGDTNISRRHCVIVNCRDDVWLYDLNSTGTYLNGERIEGKVPLIGRNIVRIGNKEFNITSDQDGLI